MLPTPAWSTRLRSRLSEQLCVGPAVWAGHRSDFSKGEAVRFVYKKLESKYTTSGDEYHQYWNTCQLTRCDTRKPSIYVIRS